MFLCPAFVSGDQQFTRNVSAEIFVVCREFLAPKAIDSKFLDPKYVFKDLEASVSLEKGVTVNNAQANVFQPEKKRRHREGYGPTWTTSRSWGRATSKLCLSGALPSEKRFVLELRQFFCPSLCLSSWVWR